jgi:hypothetical protein
MTSIHRASLRSLPVFVLLLLVGCSRSLPDPTPGSVIDSESPTPDAVAVDVALAGDPPLPGQSREGWPGLVEPKSGGEHHHHHGKSAKPAQPDQSAQPAQGGEHDH